MFKVGDVVRPYHPLSVHVDSPPTTMAHTKAHVADAVAAPSPSANEAPRVIRSQAQLRSIGAKMTPTKGQPVPNTHSMEVMICNRSVTNRKGSMPESREGMDVLYNAIQGVGR